MKKKRGRGRPPKVKSVPKSVPIIEPSLPVMPIEAPLMSVEALKPSEPTDDKLYREVLLKALTKDIGVPENEAKEIAFKYNRISVLAKAIKEGVSLPVSDEVYLKIKRLCLCR